MVDEVLAEQLNDGWMTFKRSLLETRAIRAN